MIVWKPLLVGLPATSEVFALGWRGGNGASIFCPTGTEVGSVHLPRGATLANIEWSCCGKYLILLCDSPQKVFMWRYGKGSSEATGVAHKDVTSFASNPRQHIVALGTARGGVILHNADCANSRKDATINIFNKPIRYLAWIDADLLFTASDEQTAIVSRSKGVVLKHFSPKGVICSLAMAFRQTALATLAGEIYLLNADGWLPIMPAEVQCGLQGESKLMWFDSDRVAALSRHDGMCIFNIDWTSGVVEPLQEAPHLPCIAIEASVLSPTRKNLAVATGGRIALVRPFKSNGPATVGAHLRPTGRGEEIVAMAWSSGDQFLTAATRDGSVVTFSWPSRLLCATYKDSILLSRSLTTVSLQDPSEGESIFTCPLASEMIFLGPTHCAAVHRNQANTHQFGVAVSQKELEASCSLSFPSPIKLLSLGAAYAVLVVERQVLLLHLRRQAYASGGHRAPNRARDELEDKCNAEPHQTLELDSPVAIATASWWYALTDGAGSLRYYAVDGGFLFEKYRHVLPIDILKISSNENYLAFIDRKGKAFIYSLGNSLCFALDLTAIGAANNLFWDVKCNESLLVLTSDSTAAPFKCCAPTADKGEGLNQIPVLQLEGVKAVAVGMYSYKLDGSSLPVALINGELLTRVSDCGARSTLPLSCFARQHAGFSTDEKLGRVIEPTSITIDRLLQHLALGRHEIAMEFLEERCGADDIAFQSEPIRACFEAVGWNAFYALSLDVASHAFAAAGRGDMVAWIATFQDLEEGSALRAYVRAFQQQWKKTIKLLSNGAEPQAALDMACQSGEWQAAVELSKACHSNLIPQLQQRHALHFEKVRAFSAALSVFSAATKSIMCIVQSIEGELGANFGILRKQETEDHRPKRHETGEVDSNIERMHELLLECLRGKARCALKAGELQKGLQLAADIDDPLTYKQCARILLRLGHKRHAAGLLHKAGESERAAALYILDGEFALSAPLVRSVGPSSGLLETYAHAREQQQPLEALRAFVRAEDFTSVVRILGSRLGRWEEAKVLIRSTCDRDAATFLADCCCARNDFRGAVEMLCIGGEEERAISLAEATQEAAALTGALIEAATADQHLRVSMLLEGQGLLCQSARHRVLAHLHGEALDLLLKAGEEHWAEALELVVELDDSQLAGRLMERLESQSPYCLSEVCRFPMNSLSCRVGTPLEAAERGLALAEHYKQQGHFAAAHAQLLNSLLAWKKNQRGIRLRKMPFWRHGANHNAREEQELLYSRLLHNFSLLHSYLLVPRLLSQGEHYNAALLLMRLSSFISEFEADATNVLTSTLLVGAAAGFPSSAVAVAGGRFLLPEIKSQIAAQDKKPLERVLRLQHSDRSARRLRPCLNCSSNIEEDAIYCQSCKSASPLCAASGLLLTDSQCAACPVCQFPANVKDLEKAYSQQRECPVCREPLHDGEWLMLPVKEAAPCALYIQPLHQVADIANHAKHIKAGFEPCFYLQN
ncbi:hypothetical protein Efla_002877 [Eimeria flavescens]